MNTTSLSLRFLFTVVVPRIFASANFRNSDFSFDFPKYCAIFPRNVTQNIVSRLNYSLEIARNFARKFGRTKRNLSNFVCITFAQYCS